MKHKLGKCVAVILMVALTAGVSSYLTRHVLWKQGYRPRSKIIEGGMAYGSPGPSGAVENEFFGDAAEVRAFWMMKAWHDEPYEMFCTLSDYDETGNPRCWTMRCGDIPKQTVDYFYYKGEGAVVHALILPGKEPGAGFMYEDLDGDGRLDVAKDQTAGKKHVLVENVWAEVVEEQEGSASLEEARRASAKFSGEQVHVVFRDGAWLLPD